MAVFREVALNGSGTRAGAGVCAAVGGSEAGGAWQQPDELLSGAQERGLLQPKRLRQELRKATEQCHHMLKAPQKLNELLQGSLPT